jgi:hypothetical protein
MKLRRLRIALALAAATFAVAVVPAGAATERQRLPSLEFIGETIFATGFSFAGTNVGGLSGIAYDAKRGVYHSISDDRSELGAARFYTLRVDLADGGLDAGDVTFTGVTTLRQPDGSAFAPLSLDPEGLALTEDDELVVVSEGDAVRLIAPFVRTFDLGGRSLDALPVPSYFLPTPGGTSGIRNNLAFVTLDNFEGMTFGPDLRDGRRSLVLVSDNNFSPAAFTQFLAFAYSD